MQKYPHLNRGVKKGPFIYQSRKMVSHIQFSWKKGAYRIPGSAEKGAIRAAHLYLAYIGSYNPGEIVDILDIF